ncbi:hypothetical protein K458DRAFT_3228 [Lentithecium fluviatile CBS 122367]|uniref:Uncharacterized protein n=1 Tax=Lentithecium fluviatile CBS 122367 TaxID=1168545 RepID=A0A6G1JM20_9PLEO|nr:hypothetical protein K458DRAFT_3228 [Lentithecium fluviatile CBS 122367]
MVGGCGRTDAINDINANNTPQKCRLSFVNTDATRRTIHANNQCLHPSLCMPIVLPARDLGSPVQTFDSAVIRAWLADQPASPRPSRLLSDESYVEENAVLEDDATTPNIIAPSTSYANALSRAKTYSDLRLLNKPVRYGVMGAERDDLPKDIHLLTEDL